MKTLNYIVGLLLLASVVSAQTVPSVGEISYHQSQDGSILTLQWKKVDANVAGGQITYRVVRVRGYVENHSGTADTVIVDSLSISDGPRQIIPQYTDQQKVSNCYIYKYTVNAVETIKDVVIEGPSSVVIPQIKGGVNAVVIHKTLDVSAVAGSLDPIKKLQVCDSKDGAVLHYILHDGKDAGLEIDQDGVISGHPFHPNGLRTVPVSGMVSDGVDSDKFSFKINVAPPSTARITGKIDFGPGTPFIVNLTLRDVSNSGLSFTTSSHITDGSFVFENVIPDTYQLSYTAPEIGNDVRWYKGNFSGQDSATLIIVTASDHQPPLDPIRIIRPEPRKGIKLSGKIHVLKGISKSILVQALEVSGFLRRKVDIGVGLPQPRLSEGASALVDDSGVYSLTLDTGSTYVLLATAPGYQSHFIGANDSCSSPYCAQTFSPRNDTAVSDSYVAPSDTSGQQISGNVSSLTSSSTGVRAMILLSSSKQGTITSGYSGGLVPFEAVTSDDAGNFTINSVARDTTGTTKYLLQAVPFQNFVPAYYASNDSVWSTMLWEHAKMFAVDSVKKDPLQVYIHVQPIATGTGTIAGHVVEVSNEVEASSFQAYVYAVDQATMTASGYALTDINGNYAISNLPAGTYSIFADKISYHFGWAGDIPLLSTDTGSKIMPPLRLSRDVAGVGERVNASMNDDLLSAYPNPFSAATVMHVQSAAGSTLKVFDMLGRECADLSAQLRSGNSLVSFRPDHLVPGAYVVKLQGPRGFTTRPLMIVR